MRKAICAVFLAVVLWPVAAAAQAPANPTTTTILTGTVELAAPSLATLPADEPMLVMQASQVPIRVQWDPNPAADNVTNYTITLDAIAPANVPLTACTNVCEVAFTVAVGSHTVTVTATNAWGTSAPTSVTQQITPPTPPRNLRIVK